MPVERLISKGHALEYAERIRRGEKIEVERFNMPGPPDTTHVAVMDAQGNCVTITHSLAMPTGVTQLCASQTPSILAAFTALACKTGAYRVAPTQDQMALPWA